MPHMTILEEPGAADVTVIVLGSVVAFSLFGERNQRPVGRSVCPQSGAHKRTYRISSTQNSVYNIYVYSI